MSEKDTQPQHGVPAGNEEHVTIGETTTQEFLTDIREEQGSADTFMRMAKEATENLKQEMMKCACKKETDLPKEKKMNPEEIENLLREKEIQLRTEYDKILDKEKALLKERFDYILLNEQTRASFMLREAHRERQEKITALQSQLECKNLAALMYVMCTERSRSKFEKTKIIKEYTAYIHELQDILTEGQELILHLSRGYKTAARVDHEWREKMSKIVKEFMSFIYNFAGSPETNQYFFDLPSLMKTEASLEDDPFEDPCDYEVPFEATYAEEIRREKTWWEGLDKDSRPFVVFGDLYDCRPEERRQIIKAIKGHKSAPRKWQQYLFNEMFLNSGCQHLPEITEHHPLRLPPTCKFECLNGTTVNGEGREKSSSKQSLMPPQPRRGHSASVDYRGNMMGSLLKIITTPQVAPTSSTKTALLGARDSMEIASTTKLREGTASRIFHEKQEEDVSKEVVLAIGKKRPSVFEAPLPVKQEEEEPITHVHLEDDESATIIGSITDSLEVIQNHVPDRDDKINYERVCPKEACQRMQVDSFMRSLPPYMRANPFTHFQQTFDGYETCSPEQLEMLRQRIESKKTREEEEMESGEESPLSEWIGRGVAVQTSEQSIKLPPCTCYSSPSPVSSNLIFNVEDLMPVKIAMDAIHKECLYDHRIEFDRFKVIGQESTETTQDQPKKDFKEARCHEITAILKTHPSLLDIFQANS